MDQQKRALTIFASDRIRMHPNALTSDGLSTAIEPIMLLPLDATDEVLAEAIDACLRQAKSNLTYEEWKAHKILDFFKKMKAKTQRAMGKGLYIISEGEMYTFYPIDKKGLFEDAMEVSKSNVVSMVKDILGLVND